MVASAIVGGRDGMANKNYSQSTKPSFAMCPITLTRAFNGLFLESLTGNLRLTTIVYWRLRSSTIGSVQDSSITTRTNSAMKAVLSRIYASGS